MTDHTVTARITVSGEGIDRARLQSILDAGLKELPGFAARYGVTVTDASATIDDA